MDQLLSFLITTLIGGTDEDRKPAHLMNFTTSLAPVADFSRQQMGVAGD